MDESLVAQRPGRAPPVEKEWELESKDSRQDGGDEDEGEDESSLEQQKRDVLIQEELNWLRKHNPPEYVRRMDEAAKRAEFRQWFRVMDADGSGDISAEELEEPLVSMGFAQSAREVRRMVADVDEDGSGEIDFDEFFQMMTKGSAESNPVVKLYDALSSGELGDRSLQLESLLSTYRRRVLLQSLMADNHTRERYYHALRSVLDNQGDEESEDDESKDGASQDEASKARARLRDVATDDVRRARIREEVQQRMAQRAADAVARRGPMPRHGAAAEVLRGKPSSIAPSPQRGAGSEAFSQIQTRPLPKRSPQGAGGGGEGKGEVGAAPGAGRPPRPTQPRDRYVPATPSALATALMRTVPAGLSNVPGIPRTRRNVSTAMRRRAGPSPSSPPRAGASPRARTAGPKGHLRPLAAPGPRRQGPPPPPALSSPVRYIPSRRHAPAAAVLAPTGRGVGAPLPGAPNAWAEAPRGNVPPAAPAPSPGQRRGRGGAAGGGTRVPVLSSPPPQKTQSRPGGRRQGNKHGSGNENKHKAGVWGYATPRNEPQQGGKSGAQRASRLTSNDPVPSAHVLEVPLGVKYGLGT